MKNINTYEILNLFGIHDILNVSSIKTGHINHTFLADCRNGKYILQSLNRKIFKNPYAVMNNIAKIEQTFRSSGQNKITVPHYIKTKNKSFLEINGEIWRVYEYTENSKIPENNDYLTGFAFGKFINLMNSKNIILEDTIENFHDFNKYYNRIPNEFLKRFDKLRGKFEIFNNIPKRNVHNDAKADNIIFGKSTTIIDLDTAMNSFVAIDYGDIIRSGGNIINITQGFADGLDGLLSEDEINSLYYGILYVISELAMRYIIDCVSDERYFSATSPQQCHKRAEELLIQLDYFENNSDIQNIIIKSF